MLSLHLKNTKGIEGICPGAEGDPLGIPGGSAPKSGDLAILKYLALGFWGDPAQPTSPFIILKKGMHADSGEILWASNLEFYQQMVA